MILLANLGWPSLLLTGRIIAFVPIVVGLVVEFFHLRYFTALRGTRCLWADVSMNLGSALLGLGLIPLSGLGWELIAGFTIHPLMGVGTFNPLAWTVSVLLAAIVNAFVEGYILWRWFEVTLGRRGFWLLAAVNLITVGIAAISIIIDPPKF